MNDLISRLSEIRSNYNCFDETEEPYYRALSEAIQLASAQPTLYGYDITHLMMIAEILKKENLQPERVDDALTDIEQIINIVRGEFEETLVESMKHFKN